MLKDTFKAPCLVALNMYLALLNPIWRSSPVHHGTKFKLTLALKARKSSSLHTILS